jgi:hypothetical protein
MLSEKRHILRKYREAVTRLVFGLAIVVGAGLLACFRGDSVPSGPGLFFWVGGGKGSSILGWMTPGLGEGLLGSGSLGIIYLLVSVIVVILGDTGKIPSFTKRTLARASLSALRSGLPAGSVLALFSALVFSHEGLAYGLFRGEGIGIFSGLIVALLGGLLTLLRSEPGPAPNARPSRPPSTRLLDAGVFGLCGASGFASLFALQSGGINQLVISYGLIIGLFYAIVFGIANGVELLHPLGVTIKPAEQVAWSWRAVQHGLLEVIKKGAWLCTYVLVSVVLVIAGISSVFYGISYGLRYGLIYGLIVGLTAWVASILIGVVQTGWSSEMLPEHHLSRPNEGIRRSLSHAGFAALLFGPAGGIATGGISALAFGLGGVAGWPILAAGFTVIFGCIFAFHFLTVQGGIACLEHYVLRYSLWKTGEFPWNAVRFLDFAQERILLRKVGGGYIFVHRLLLEYFSSLPPSVKDQHK